MKQLTRLRGYTDQMVEDANALIFTFGSYRLGVRLLALFCCMVALRYRHTLTVVFYVGTWSWC